MTRRQYIELLQSETSGGKITDEVRLNYRLMGAFLDIGREMAITMYAEKKGGAPAQLYQTTYPMFKNDTQEDDCNTIFAMPGPVVQIDQATSSISYIGGESGMDPYIRSSDRSSFANQMQHWLMSSIASKRPVSLYIPEFNYIVINKTPGNLPKRIMVTGIFAYPTDVPEYNPDIDNYPITNEIFSIAKDYIYRTSIAEMMTKIPDIISNGTDDMSIMQKQRGR